MVNSQNPDKDLIPIGEAAQILGVSPSTLRRWERQEKILGYRTAGNQRRYRRRDVDALHPQPVEASV